MLNCQNRSTLLTSHIFDHPPAPHEVGLARPSHGAGRPKGGLRGGAFGFCIARARLFGQATRFGGWFKGKPKGHTTIFACPLERDTPGWQLAMKQMETDWGVSLGWVQREAKMKPPFGGSPYFEIHPSADIIYKRIYAHPPIWPCISIGNHFKSADLTKMMSTKG